MSKTKLTDVEGIGPIYAARLESIGIKTAEKLLIEGATRLGRKKISKASGLPESFVLKLINMVDLTRIKGIGSEYSELLMKAGVNTVKELRRRNPENLLVSMEYANQEGKPLVRLMPSIKNVTRWVNLAKELKPVLTY